MTVSPASLTPVPARRLLAVLVAACCAASVAPASAQTGADRPATRSPIQLVPLGDTPRRAAPKEVQAPPQASPPAASTKEAEPLAPVPVVPVTTTDGAVEVDTLSAIDPESVGILDESGGGLPPTLWQGTGRALAIRLIEALPVPQVSRTLRSLTRRLLLTRATAPLGKSKEPGTLVTARVRKLIALGDQRGALDLVQAAPQGLMNETLAELETQALFLDNDNARACSKVEGHARD
jgi:hypothetical protein